MARVVEADKQKGQAAAALSTAQPIGAAEAAQSPEGSAGGLSRLDRRELTARGMGLAPTMTTAEIRPVTRTPQMPKAKIR